MCKRSFISGCLLSGAWADVFGAGRRPRYKAAGFLGSGVVVLEAAVRRHEEGLGLRHRGIAALNSRSEAWLEQLPPETRLKVGAPPPTFTSTFPRPWPPALAVCRSRSATPEKE